MAILDFTTSGKMRITLQGARFGNVLGDPDRDPNVKHFAVGPQHIELDVHDMNKFTSWGRVQVLEEGYPGGVMTVEIDTNAIGWYGSAQFKLHYENGQHIVSDNFQSAVGGTPGSARIKRYNITTFKA